MQSLMYWFRWLFTKTLPAGRLLGIPLRVHLLLLIFIPYLALFFFRSYASFLGTAGGIFFAGAFVATLYLSVLAHEFGHAWGNRLVGGRTEQILLTPVGGVAVGSGADLSPRTELLVTALGPAVSVALALAAHGALWLLPPVGEMYLAGRMPLLWLILLVAMVAHINTMLSIFNLCFPLFPMDCARLIRGGFSLKYNPQLVTLRVCRLGIGVGIFLLIGLFFRVSLPFFGEISAWLVLIGVLGIMACLQELERIKYMSVYAKSDTWGTRTVFYDHEEMAQAKVRAFEDVGALIRRKPAAAARKKKPRRTGPAQIIDIAPNDPDKVSDVARLQQMMKEAADAEDFVRAARIKRRLRQLQDRDEPPEAGER